MTAGPASDLVARWRLLVSALRDGRLSRGDCAALAVILDRFGRNKTSWASLKKVAEGAGVSRATATRAVATLVELGYLVRQSGTRTKSNQYFLGIPPRCTDEPRYMDEPRRTGAHDVGACVSLSVGAPVSHESASLNQLGEPREEPTLGNQKNNKAEPLRQITEDAVETFNAVLGKPTGLLPAIRLQVARDKRESQVRRVLGTARDICGESYGSPTITREFWIDYWALVDQDDFHSGRRAGGPGHENWRPDFEFLTRPQTLLKIYDRASSALSE